MSTRKLLPLFIFVFQIVLAAAPSTLNAQETLKYQFGYEQLGFADLFQDPDAYHGVSTYFFNNIPLSVAGSLEISINSESTIARVNPSLTWASEAFDFYGVFDVEGTVNKYETRGVEVIEITFRTTTTYTPEECEDGFFDGLPCQDRTVEPLAKLTLIGDELYLVAFGNHDPDATFFTWHSIPRLGRAIAVPEPSCGGMIFASLLLLRRRATQASGRFVGLT